LLPVDARFGQDWAASLAIGPAWPLFLHVLERADWRSGRALLNPTALTAPAGPIPRTTFRRWLAILAGANPTAEAFVAILHREPGRLELQVRDLRAVQAIRARQPGQKWPPPGQKWPDAGQKWSESGQIWPSPSLSDSPVLTGSSPDPEAGAHEEPSPDAALWQEVLSRLRGAMTAANFKTWLVGTVPVERRGAVLVVRAPNCFVQEWLQTRFRPLVARTLRDVAPELADVAFIAA
jgi:hypothetical protein